MYEGLPIATNKISVEERRSVPHHLLGCIKLNEEPWTVTEFEAQATQIVEQIRSRGRLPIAVGGTHYYMQSLLFKDALVDVGVDHMSIEEQEKLWPVLGASSADMLAELKRIDPIMALRWHPKDARKIRRSLEIYLTTGRKASEIYEEQREQRADDANGSHADYNNTQDDCSRGSSHQTASSLRCDPLILWTHTSPEILRSRLTDRVETMLRDGLLMEVESLHTFQREQQSEEPVADQSRGIWIAIGYKEFLPYLLAMKAGATSAKDLERLKLDGIEKTHIRTRQYAKSQTRWIRGKLLAALGRENLDNSLFLLDATDLSKWRENVMAVADQITTAFLGGNDLPEPRDYFEAAHSMLRPIKDQKSYARQCEVCDKIIMTEDAWETHLKGRKHKATARCKQEDKEAIWPDGNLLSLRHDRSEK